MRQLLVVLCSVLAYSGTVPPFRFDSATSTPLQGRVENLVLRSDKKEGPTLYDELEEQLLYLTGTLNQYYSCADIANADFQIQKTVPVAGTNFSDITYSADFLVSWSKAFKVPESLVLAAPFQTDATNQKKYFDTYCKTCSEDPTDNLLDVTSFFYYYRPNKTGCPIFESKKPIDGISYATVKFSPSTKQTQGKYPEYNKVWADGRLVYTAIFGTNETKATAGDWGVDAYNWMHWYLRKYLGDPVKANVALKAEEMPGQAHPDVEMEWETPDGRVNVNILLIDKHALSNGDKVFAARYNERTKISDVVAYNGHSDFGVNIRALTELGSFSPGQWQLYYMNGCATFAYLDDSLRAAHQKINPNSKPYEFFNLITNAMSTPFYSFGPSNMTIIEAMLKKRKTYHQLLSDVDPYQTANVTGEEENQFKP